MARPKSPALEAALARAREIQPKRRLPLRELSAVLLKEGHDVPYATLSKEGLAAENFGGLASMVPTVTPGSHSRVDTTGTPLEMARALAAGVAAELEKVDKDSGPAARMNTELRNLIKLVAALEAERLGGLTPAEVERTQRIADGETVRLIELYVSQALNEALKPSPSAPHGRCPTCEQTLTEAARAALEA